MRSSYDVFAAIHLERVAGEPAFGQSPKTLFGRDVHDGVDDRMPLARKARQSLAAGVG